MRRVAAPTLWGSTMPKCWRWWQDSNRRTYYKSMTTHADHTIWQDVYRPSTAVGDVYLKLTVIDDVLIVSFKEL